MRTRRPRTSCSAGTTDPPAQRADKLVTTGAIAHKGQFTCTFKRSS